MKLEFRVYPTQLGFEAKIVIDDEVVTKEKDGATRKEIFIVSDEGSCFEEIVPRLCVKLREESIRRGIFFVELERRTLH